VSNYVQNNRKKGVEDVLEYLKLHNDELVNLIDFLRPVISLKQKFHGQDQGLPEPGSVKTLRETPFMRAIK